MKEFRKFEKVTNGTPFKNSFFLYFMLGHHLSNVLNGVLIRERALISLMFIDKACSLPQRNYEEKLSLILQPLSLFQSTFNYMAVRIQGSEFKLA